MAARITKDDFEKKVLNSEIPVVVDFYSDSCVACKKLAPVLGDFEDNYEGKVLVFKVNTNFDSELAAQYRVMSNPTILVFKSGVQVAKKVGAPTYSELETWVLEHI